MKATLAALSLLALSAFGAVAQAPKVPTGIDVPGSTYYTIAPGETRVVQKDRDCSARDDAVKNARCVSGTEGIAEREAAPEAVGSTGSPK